MKRTLLRGAGKDAEGVHAHTHTNGPGWSGLAVLGKRLFPADFSGPRRSWKVIQKVCFLLTMVQIDFLDPNSFEFPSW